MEIFGTSQCACYELAPHGKQHYGPKLGRCIYFKAKVIFGITKEVCKQNVLNMLFEEIKEKFLGKLDANFRLPGT